MKDLKIDYTNENSIRIHTEYPTIMDFLDEMDSEGDIDIPMMDYTDVEADFFENPLLHQHFDSIESLYIHCKRILH